MPLASPCIASLNRAGRHWQPFQIFTASRSIPRRGYHSHSKPIVESWLPQAAIKQDSLAPKTWLSHRRRLEAASSVARSPTHQQLTSRTVNPLNACEDDSEFTWSEFVSTRGEQLNSENRHGTPAPSDLPGRARHQTWDDISLWTRNLEADPTKVEAGVMNQLFLNVMDQHVFRGAEGPDADVFYHAVLDAALPSDSLLEQIQLYAAWLVEARGMQWPSLYRRVISYCLEHRQYTRAFKWHMALVADFDPGSEAFGDLLLCYARESGHDTGLQSVLQSLYVASLHRNLYDTLVPGLYEQGRSRLAHRWRDLCIRFRDMPQPGSTAHHYLAFLRTYFPLKPLVLEEEVVEGLASTVFPTTADDTGREVRGSSDSAQESHDTKSIRDSLGARLFASSWIPVDFAIHALQGLGVHTLGPLCLQALALRDPTPSSVLSRLKQLEKLSIKTAESIYSQAIWHFAATDNGELLDSLLGTDIHPDVFDDSATQRSILDSAIAAGDEKTSRLLLAIQPAVVQQSIDATSNELLRLYVSRGETRLAVGIMDDMRAMQVVVAPETIAAIHQYLMDAASLDMAATSASQTTHQVQGNVELAGRMSLSRHMVPSKFWRDTIFQLGRANLFHAIERLSLDLLDSFDTQATNEGGFIFAHPSDVPTGTEAKGRHEIPADLPLRNEWHPLTRVFNDRVLQAYIIQWGVKKGLACGSGDRRRVLLQIGRQPRDFQLARGTSLLKELNDRGIPISHDFVRDEVIRCIAAHLWQPPLPSSAGSGIPRPYRDSLQEVSKQFNSSMGVKILPPARELFSLLAKASRNSISPGT